ncbi:metallophosphoesterase [Ruminococcus sp.]
MTYAISDIHGCYEEYIKLIEKIEFSDNDTLYILGDICDRGEKPMEIYYDIMARDNVIPLFGNHEHLAYINLRHLIKNLYTQIKYSNDQ